MPFPLNPPSDFFEGAVIPEVGELMVASFPLTENKMSMFSVKWWLGEKYDGMRCCWNPLRQILYSRHGNALPISNQIASSLPSVTLDGEIWFGRGLFYLVHNLRGEETEYFEWYNSRLLSFDVPSHIFQKNTFEERYRILLENIDPSNLYVIVAMRVACRSRYHLNDFMQLVVDEGGEGVILRKERSLYEHGKSLSLLKIKSYFEDKEGIVIGYGDRNSVCLKLPNGITFEVPARDVLIPTPPIGSVVTFCYESYSRKDVPLNPIITRIRADISWEEVLRGSLPERKLKQSQQFGYWTLENMRQYFENFAKSRNLDPLSAETWYSFPISDILQAKGGKLILKKLGGYFKAVHDLFPEIKFNDSLFPRSPWLDIRQRKKFFEDYAKTNRFDPQNPTSWYKQPHARIMAAKGAYTLIGYHNYNMAKALMDLYPNIGLEKHKLWTQHPHVEAMQNSKNRRKFFLKYAAEKGFDPLVAENWYKQSRKSIVESKRAASVLHYHNNSVARALLDLFPDIGLEKSKLLNRPAWHDKGVRRKFFEIFASKRGFDPLAPKNWYSLPRDAIMSAKGILQVIYYHKGSVLKALMDLFPEIGLEKSKLWTLSSWSDPKNRRKFFEHFSKQKGFDPVKPENWYSQVQAITDMKGTKRVIFYHKNSVARALLDLFPEVSFDKTKLYARSAWHLESSRKQFFENYAATNGFNPLDPEQWYFQARNKIMTTKGAANVLYYHKNSIARALQDLFPNIGIDAAKLWNRRPRNIVENRRKFFEDFAKENDFDPLNPLHWYSLGRKKIMSTPGISTVLYYHNNSASAALIELFPDIGLEKDKLWTR
eukprot:Phypoly_transcript_01460.p1 GENE.Phypoly_transcript_01460~~Phypoly_transcript_01460.p1  ORF type:complete len:826 (+),score=126.37 Phypoly_transcript_01460:385-2862(+)